MYTIKDDVIKDPVHKGDDDFLSFLKDFRHNNVIVV